jgi:hypothetical protein
LGSTSGRYLSYTTALPAVGSMMTWSVSFGVVNSPPGTSQFSGLTTFTPVNVSSLLFEAVDRFDGYFDGRPEQGAREASVLVPCFLQLMRSWVPFGIRVPAVILVSVVPIVQPAAWAALAGEGP